LSLYYKRYYTIYFYKNKNVARATDERETKLIARVLGVTWVLEDPALEDEAEAADDIELFMDPAAPDIVDAALAIVLAAFAAPALAAEVAWLPAFAMVFAAFETIVAAAFIPELAIFPAPEAALFIAP
jgi:hypothetical protein